MGLLKFLGVLSPAHINLFTALKGGDKVGADDYGNTYYRADQVANGDVDRGILICGTGIGMAIAANKVPGIRATTCHDEVTAEICRRHNDVNVLCLSADLVGEQRIQRLVEVWLSTEFDGGRHARGHRGKNGARGVEPAAFDC